MLERYLMFFGDSHTAGSSDPAALGWVGRAAAAALEEGIPLTPYNLGVGGETSVEVAARWRAEALPRLPAEGEGDPRAVFAFGVNDLTLCNGAPRCSHEESLGALEGVLDGADELGMRSFVVGPAAIDDEAENERIADLSRAFEELCARREVPFVPLVENLRSSEPWRRELAAGDGAHPGARGYEEMARLVLAAGWIDWLRS
ncbi:MAG TPA: GDSL-type esterase/lipase family protein [Solirubrobacterales bacterium]|nr:GDSL-type esterase/lipase family protein [Solirubrobacterales bacterium]